MEKNSSNVLLPTCSDSNMTEKPGNSHLFNILLPACTESKVDIFLNILQNIVARSKINDHILTNAFISGMSGKPFEVTLDDMKLNWKQLTSESQQIRQAKLLGFWTIEKFPSMGKKIFGDKYQSSGRNAVKVINNSEIQADNIDDFILPKMKLRVIQLSVCDSTIKKLKHFVKVPECVREKKSGRGISNKMIKFDVKTNYVESCWEALRIGEFSMDLQNEHQANESFTVMHPCIVLMNDIADHQIDSNENSRTFPPSKRQCLSLCSDHATTIDEEVDADSNIDFPIAPPLKTSCQEMDYSNERDPDCERVGTMNAEDTGRDSSIGSLRNTILRMQHDINNLKKAVRDTSTDRLHVMMMKEKDDEIVLIKASEKKLLQANGQLINTQTNLQHKIEKQADLIVSLQKGVDNSSSLYEKSKVELEASLDLLNSLKRENEKFHEISASEKKLLQANKLLISSQTNLQQKIDEQASLIVSLQKGVDNSSSLYAKSKVELELSLDLMKTMKSDMATKFIPIEEVNELDKKWACAKQELYELKCYAARKEKELIAANNLINANSKLGDELADLKDRTINIVSKLNSEIVDLEKINEESIKRNYKLETELNALNAEKKSKELKNQKTSDMATQTEIVGESSGDISTHNILNGGKLSKSDSESDFETDDPVVKLFRKKLPLLTFGWMKFSLKKNAKFFPGLVWPPDNDGIKRAQKIEVTGYPSDTKNEFFEFEENIHEDKKKQPEKLALTKFNNKFKSSFQ